MNSRASQRRLVRGVAGELEGQAAVGQDELSRASQRRLVRGVAGELEGEIGFDGVVQMPGAAVVEGPAAVLGLRGEQVLGDPPLERFRAPPHETVEDNVLRVHGGIRLQGRVPESLRMLRGQKLLSAAANRLIEMAAQLFTRERRDVGRHPLRHPFHLLPFVLSVRCR